MMSDHEKVMEHEKLEKLKKKKKSWNFVISHGILPIVTQYFTRFVPFLTEGDKEIDQQCKKSIFWPFL